MHHRSDFTTKGEPMAVDNPHRRLSTPFGFPDGQCEGHHCKQPSDRLTPLVDAKWANVLGH